MTTGSEDQSVGPWAKEKLDSLERYLEYYTTRLKKQEWCQGLYYIDAFAGPGRSPIRGTSPGATDPTQADLFSDTTDGDDEGKVEYIKGSPRVALEIENPFTHYLFIDNNPTRLGELASLNSPLKKASLTGFHATAKHIAVKAVSPSSETMRTI